MIMYIEDLRFLFVLKTIFTFRNDSKNKIFYFDSYGPSMQLVRLANKIFKGNFERLDFKMKDIKDKNGELVRVRIPRKDLFSIQNKIINHNTYESIIRKEKLSDRFNRFIQKGLIDGETLEKNSVSRILYIINVVNWHKQKFHFHDAEFIINYRPWIDIYFDYAKKYGIKLIIGKKYKKSLISVMKNYVTGFIKRNTKLLIIADNIRKKKITIDSINPESSPLLYLQGRGDVNISNDGNHSDFFWVMNSNYPSKNILYDFHSDFEKKTLNKFGVELNEKKIIYCPNNNVKVNLNINKNNKPENNEIEKLTLEYNSLRSYWYSFFITHNVKLFLTWYKYSHHHIAIADAIKDYGGISAVWQLAFDGDAYIETKTVADIVFTYSQYSANLDSQLNSKIEYNIVTGYSKDYAPPLLKTVAKELREKLKKQGAKKIIFAIDENSVDDSRWHTGHELQRENYSFICEKVLEIPWLGVVFKPKNAGNLRYRLGPVNELLKAAEATGRCYIFEKSGRNTTLAAPLLAGLAADVCIHGHLSSGTAALECALAGRPTLLIDREGCFSHKLHELPEDLVVHEHWPGAIEKTIEHFETPGGIPGFGDWSDHLNEFDPFRDGKAAYRMGTYLNWLVQGFEDGLDRETIMADAADRYAKEWGSDKVIVA